MMEQSYQQFLSVSRLPQLSKEETSSLPTRYTQSTVALETLLLAEADNSGKLSYMADLFADGNLLYTSPCIVKVGQLEQKKKSLSVFS